MFGGKFFKIIFSFLFLIGIIFSSFGLAQAASYGVTPLIVDIKAEARDIIKKSITISNDGEEKVDLYPFVNNVLGGEGGVQVFQDIADADKSVSLANWIQFPRAVIELEPGDSRTIVFTIQVNLEAKPGVYHARISFPAGPTRDQAEVNIDKSPAVMINLEVTEKVNELLELRKFLSGKSFFLNLPANLLYSVENVGNKEISPKGEVIIYDRKGKEVGSLAVNAEGKKIPPGNVLDFESEFEKGNFFGKYKAFLNIRYGENQKGTINDTIYFYIIPWQKLLILLSAVIALAWLLSIWIHKRRSSVPSHSGALSHTIFHSAHTGHKRPIYYHELEKESSHVKKAIAGSNHNGHKVNVNGHDKNHNINHGHVMDLRRHKRK